MPATVSKQIEMDWNSAPEFGRRDTLLYALRRCNQVLDKPAVIVEIGTSRDERPEACDGDGWSTRAWGWYAQQTGVRHTPSILPRKRLKPANDPLNFFEIHTHLADDLLASAQLG